MDQMRLTKSAEKLEEMLLRYSAVDAEVGALFHALSSLINDVRVGKIVAPLDWREVSGGYHFTEGGLRKYAALESAYADFKIEITGGESPVLRNMRLNAASRT